MEQSRKHLKINSIVLLIFTACSALELGVGLWFEDFSGATIPEGAPENIIMITKIIVLVFSALILLPQFYVGFKGLQVAKKPSSSTRHIFWAKVIFILLVISAISSVIDLIQHGNANDEVRIILSTVVEILIYVDFIKAANLVAKNN